jgi:MtN3 and saliva related transmembrane protein
VTDLLAVLATGWGLIMAIAPLLQIRRMLHTRSSADVSLGYLAVLQIGFVLWLSYGVSIGNAALMIANTASVLVGVATIAVALRLRRRRSSGVQADATGAGTPAGLR